MSDVRIKAQADGERSLPVFQEIDRRLDAVRQRAYDLFSKRGRSGGNDLGDWVTAEREVLGFALGELKDRDGEYEVDLALPGFGAEDVELTATPNELIIHAESSTRRKGSDEAMVWSEFGSSEVYRRFTLPTSIEADRISAELMNGVLHVHAPKSPAVPSATADSAISTKPASAPTATTPNGRTQELRA
ncbi:MAG: Hsp20 family protein [Gemmatimonadota bacterium]